MRTAGRGDEAFVLLHGITASGEVFGAAYDRLADQARVVVPDLLGFGGSLDESRTDFSLEAHVAALEEMVQELGLAAVPLTILGHSLGALLALQWAAKRPVARVVCACAPLYADAGEADERIRAMGPLERLFALEGPVSRRACALMRRHRTAAALVLVALEPRWPVPIARAGVRHTWASYLGAMNGVIRRGGWDAALAELARREVPVLLLEGARDPVTVPGRAAELARRHRHITVQTHPEADHELPIVHAGWAVQRLLAGHP